jgi:hypothetical protein
MEKRVNIKDDCELGGTKCPLLSLSKVGYNHACWYPRCKFNSHWCRLTKNTLVDF